MEGTMIMLFLQCYSDTQNQQHHQSHLLSLEGPKMAAVQPLWPVRHSRALRALCPVSGPVTNRLPALLLAACLRTYGR